MCIKKIERKVGLGVTKPYIVELENGKRYVAKFPGNPEGDRALINEYVCGSLGKLLGLPIPDYQLVKVNNIDDFKNSLTDIKLVNGTVFCSEFLEKANPIPSYCALTSIDNKIDVIKTLIFDVVIGNNDRNPGNFLINFKNKSFVVIDHSHVFINGVLWNEKSLSEEIGKEIDISMMSPKSFEISKQLLNIIDNKNDIYDFVDKIKNIESKALYDIVNSIPNDWVISDEEKNLIVSFLIDRMNRVHIICSLLNI